MASNSATASLALLDCKGPIKCSAMPTCADINAGHFDFASCTRFSPKTRCPAAMTGVIAAASKVFETAISVTRKKVKLKALLGIRARLVLLALMLVGPLMLDRVRSLEDTRARELALMSSEFAQLAEHSAEAQREIIASVQAVLKSAAYIQV